MDTHAIPQLDAKGLRRFGLTTGAIVAGLFGVVLPYLLGHSWPIWPWILFSVLGVWALLAPRTLGPVYSAWMRFGLMASRVTTPVIMSLVFVAAILPTALILRVFGRDFMHRNFTDSGSYRVTSHKPSVDNLEKPY